MRDTIYFMMLNYRCLKITYCYLYNNEHIYLILLLLDFLLNNDKIRRSKRVHAGLFKGQWVVTNYYVLRCETKNVSHWRQFGGTVPRGPIPIHPGTKRAKRSPGKEPRLQLAPRLERPQRKKRRILTVSYSPAGFCAVLSCSNATKAAQ